MAAARRCRCGERIPSAARTRLCRGCGRRLPRRALAPGLVLLAACALSAAAGAATSFATRPRPTEAAAAPVVVVPTPPRRAAEPVVPPARPPEQPPPVVAPSVAAPADVLAAEPVGRYRVGESFEQEVSVSRRATVRVLGAAVPQAAEYVFTSRLTVSAVGADGRLTVRQRVEAARLVASDDAGRADLDVALRAARGTTFEIAVGPDGDVTELTGAAADPRVAEAADPAGGRAFRVSSLLDADGWKELAGLTFFRPPRPLAKGERWSKPASHSWGPLGSWAGRTHFTAAGPRDGAEEVGYVHELTHRAPAGGGLPFRVGRAEFAPPAAAGTIRYDAARGRVVSAAETFRVRGSVAVSVGGAEATAAVEEEQHFRLRFPAAEAQLRAGRPGG